MQLDCPSLLFGMFLSYIVGIIVSLINYFTDKALYYRNMRKSNYTK